MNRPPVPQPIKQKINQAQPQIEEEEDLEPKEEELIAPKPQGTISMNLTCI